MKWFKRLSLVVFLFMLSGFVNSISAQRGYLQQRYYSTQWAISNEYRSVPVYNNYNQIIYYQRQYRRAVWRSYTGTHTVWFWVIDDWGNGYWSSRTYYGTCWSYNWSRWYNY